MSHVKTFFPVRAISGLACAAVLLLSACGGSDSTSNRNGRLNSALCFDTQEQKTQAIADAEKALTEAQATPPLLEDASSNGASSRVNLAFIGPRLWWMPSAVDEPSTTTNPIDVATETSVPLVGEMVLQQLQDALNAATNAPLCDATDSSTAGTMVPAVEMVDTNCDINFRYDASINYLRVTACDAVTKMRFVNGSYASEGYYSSQGWVVQGGTTESYTIYIGDLVVAQGEYSLSDGDVTVTGVYQSAAPTAVDTTVDTTVGTTNVPGSTNTCTANVTSNGASFTCARELVVSFFYFLEGGNDSGNLWGDQDTVFGPIENVRDIYLSIASGGVPVLSQFTNPGTYEFEVPLADVVSEPESDEPYFSGVFNQNSSEDTVSFTIPEDYSAPYFYLQLFTECGEQSIEAEIISEGEFRFTEIPALALGDGLCGVWLVVEDAFGIPRGETFDVIIRTATEAQIMWGGTVALKGDGVSVDGYDPVVEGDQGLVWDELFSGEIDAEHVVTIEIPEGGRQVDVRAITTRFENQEDYVDPFLVIFDVTGNVVAEDNDDGENYGYGDYSSRLNVFLEEGFYTLVATTFDLWMDAEEQWPTTYDLELRVGSVPVPADQVAPSGDLPEKKVQVEVLDAPPSNLEEPKPVFALPVNEIINLDKSSNEPNPVIPAGVTEVVCDSGCLLALREAAGASEGVVTIQVGGEVIEVKPGVRNAIIPVRPTAKEIQVTVTPTDGGEPVVLSTEVLVISPRTFPTKMVEGAKSVVKTNQGSEGLPTNLIVVLSVLALAIAIGLVRRNKVRIPE